MRPFLPNKQQLQTLRVGVSRWVFNQPHWSPTIESQNEQLTCLGLIMLCSPSPKGKWKMLEYGNGSMETKVRK